MAGSKAPEFKSKRERFVHYANLRGGNACKAIDNLGKLAANKDCEFSKEDVEKLEAALTAAVSRMRAAFDKPGSRASAGGILT